MSEDRVLLSALSRRALGDPLDNQVGLKSGAEQGVPTVIQTTASEEQLVRVRVWSGQLPIVDYTADSESGAAYASAMSRRYAGLTVTIDAVTEPPAGGRAVGLHAPERLEVPPALADRVVGTRQRQAPSPDGGGSLIGRRLPVILGYVRRYPWMSERELGELQHRLAEVARHHSRTLGTVYVEELPTDPQAFEALLASMRDLAAPAVVIPSNAHLGRWDLPGSKYDVLQQAVQTQVIVADSSL